MNMDDLLNRLPHMYVRLAKMFHVKEINDWQLKPRLVHRLTMCCPVAGKALLHINKMTYHAEPGKVYFIKPGTMVAAEGSADSQAEYYLLPFAMQEVHNDHEALGDADQEEQAFPFQEEVMIQCLPQIIHLLEQIKQWHQEKKRLATMRKNILFQEVLWTIAEDQLQSFYLGRTEYSVTQVMHYMKQHYMEELKMNALAQMAGLSTSNFSREFKKVAGQRPIDYLTKLRINRAKELLVLSNHRLKTIAKSVGYQDELYFSRVFKKIVGVTPTVYVHKHRTKIATLNVSFSDYLLALGVKPVATTAYDKPDNINGYPPHIAEQLKGTKIVGALYTPSKTAIVKAEPDLILTDNRRIHRGCTDRYTEIAPTASFWDDDWKRLLKRLAMLIGKEEEARSWLADYEQQAAAARRKLHPILAAGESVLLIRIIQEEIRVYGGKRQLGAVLYKDLGLAMPNEISPEDHFITVNSDELAHYQAAHIILLAGQDKAAERKLTELGQSNWWRELPAVKQAQVYELEDRFNSHAPLVNSEALDQIVERMTAIKRIDDKFVHDI
ncbi:AraC family transcriptional regulator [Halalkalibacter oceani]|uniref:AraC family transcriptional regulator n=1 Tax=Halalkalibacter oceani TaxID=1653776 RepID=UPI00339A4A19